MKLRVTVFIMLVAAVAALIATKGIKTDNGPEDYFSNIPASQTANLIEEAKRKGQPAWLLFHSTSCQSCVEMEQVFHTLESEFKGKVAFVNINVNNPAEQELCMQYQIQYIPTTYFLNTKGEPIFNFVGVIKQDEMRAKIKALAEGK